ncbi:MAG TPA: hypothetical protein VMD49_11305 [Steroidobacteraceae bacterium]|nr:hypothetical protein [Steroidobacteraceae bacterium]
MPIGAQDIASAVAALFIVAMIWLRTRMHYAGRGRGRLELTRAGRIYFAAALAVLVVGWFCAPRLGRSLWPAAAAPGLGPDAILTRVIWFLATYYLLVVIHRVLQSRHVELFGARP